MDGWLGICSLRGILKRYFNYGSLKAIIGSEASDFEGGKEENRRQDKSLFPLPAALVPKITDVEQVHMFGLSMPLTEFLKFPTCATYWITTVVKASDQ
jgi:hypothetical protein